jgi:hypothetical protein
MSFYVFLYVRNGRNQLYGCGVASHSISELLGWRKKLLITTKLRTLDYKFNDFRRFFISWVVNFLWEIAVGLRFAIRSASHFF